MSDTGVYLGFHSGGMHDTQSDTAPAAFDHIDQMTPPNLPIKDFDAITRNPRKATPVNQRAANRLIISAVPVNGNGDAIKIVDSQKGRKGVWLQVPTGAAAPVVISHEPDNILQQNNNGWTITAGSTPIFIQTENTIWAASGTDATASVIQVIVLNTVDDEC